jgi:hypothetical protein
MVALRSVRVCDWWGWAIEDVLWMILGLRVDNARVEVRMLGIV